MKKVSINFDGFYMKSITQYAFNIIYTFDLIYFAVDDDVAINVKLNV